MPKKLGFVAKLYLLIGLTLSTAAIASYVVKLPTWARSCGLAALSQELAAAAARSFFWAPEAIYWSWFRQDIPAVSLLLPGMSPCNHGGLYSDWRTDGAAR